MTSNGNNIIHEPWSHLIGPTMGIPIWPWLCGRNRRGQSVPRGLALDPLPSFLRDNTRLICLKGDEKQFLGQVSKSNQVSCSWMVIQFDFFRIPLSYNSARMIIEHTDLLLWNIFTDWNVIGKVSLYLTMCKYYFTRICYITNSSD